MQYLNDDLRPICMIIKMDVGVIDNIQPVYVAFHLPLSLLSSYNTEVVACLLHKVTLVTLRHFKKNE